MNDRFIVSKEVISDKFNYHSNVWDIAFAADQNYASFVGIAAYSILVNNPSVSICFHIFIKDIKKYDLQLLKQIPLDNHKIILYHLNIDYFNNLPVCGHFSTGIYYRLIIPSVLSEFEKILYLDTDILCVGDLSELFNTNLRNKVIACCQDNLMQEQYLLKLNNLGFRKESCYFNSGMMLINVPEWIENDIFSRFIEFLSFNNNFDYPDQDVLNILLQDRKIILPNKFNWIEWNISSKDMIFPNENIAIIHFVGDIKPWQEAGVIDIYSKYKEKSPWKDLSLLPPNSTRNYRRFAKRLWKLGQYNKAIRYQFIYLFRKLKGLFVMK